MRMEWSKINPKMMSMFGQGGAMFGVLLPELAKEDNKIMVLSADMSSPAGLDKFKTAFPKQFLNLGIAEQNMIGVGAGLASEGYKVITEAQACFITMRSYEQIRQYLGYMRNRQVVVGLASGFSLTYMGNTHYALEDIALMRTVPGMNVVAPCDALEAMKAFECALRSDNPTYIRLFGGSGIPVVYTENFEYSIGKAIRLNEGSEIQIIATGSMVAVSKRVTERLVSEGFSVDLIDMHTVAPLNTTIISRSTKTIFTIEEHRMTGGLGDAVASFIATHEDYPNLIKIAAPDDFCSVGDYKHLLEINGLSEEKIYNKIKESI